MHEVCSEERALRACILALERSARLSIGDRHFHERGTIQHLPSIVPHVIQHQRLPVVESDPETPLLPLYEAPPMH
jgi:hypothetical protein